MKRTFLIVLALMVVMAIPAFAAPVDSTSQANYTSSDEYFESWLNEQDYIQHSHELDKVSKIQRGVGLDFVLYENPILEITSENKYNFTTFETTTFAVAKINVFKLLTK